MSRTQREIRLASRPVGWPEVGNFELAETPIPEPAEGQALVRNIYMSVDPYMRGRMRDAKSYTPPFEIGAVLAGGSLGCVEKSSNPELPEGAYVVGGQGWREYYVTDGEGQRIVDPELAPLSSYLGTMGMPGLTAYVGLLDIGKPQEGETLFVSAAAGAVGTVVGQIGKILGCRVVGSAGSDEKVSYLTESLGFDAAFNYKQADLMTALGQTCPDGIDVYFENVGGPTLEAVLHHMNPFGRIPVCGMIAQYNDEEPRPGPSNLIFVIPRRLTFRGFIVSDHQDRYSDFVRDVGGWLREGRIRTRETILQGIETAPEAFLGLLRGENTGKMLVQLADA